MTPPGKVWPWVSPLKSETELRALIELASGDHHMIFAPTHLIRRGEELLGYVSLGGATVLNAWVDSRRVSARESLFALNVVENLAAASGVKRLLLPVAENSPFFPLVGRLGYAALGKATLNWKEL